MLLVVRSLLLLLLLVAGFIFSILLVIARPRHNNNVYVFAKILSSCRHLLGIKVTVRGQAPAGSHIYIGNHQNTFDLFTITAAVQPGTVSLGKKSILWMPFFGQLYWLIGNILIDRSNRRKAIKTLNKATKKLHKTGRSLWVFPEGTRSRGRGILPFKLGAFHTALAAKSDIVPVVASCQQGLSLNRWNNGEIIIEILPPVRTDGIAPEQIKQLAESARAQMVECFDRLNAELGSKPKLDKQG
ncbi:1-acylglycerol-3-phosphate O-acyltransferase [Paraferrimonas sp. SM1919]|uniref:1-acylglycerol-3-phosphate O-acyltransferase n=1 Tax=Paraferrimonas sp. SM1919 TaxID=2662263 RepID=UPI0013D3D5B5|nr:1-acylglycerol-3-phosphate O-acyltransferase [Paraferrimonas sp. SM1919]